MTRTVRHPAPQRCRGSAYIAVLGTTMLVTLLGVSGLLAARLERAAHQADDESLRATLLAQSAAELALTESQRAGWRSRYTSGQWSSTIALGGGSLRFRYLDADDSLADDANDAFAVEAEAWFGSADAPRTRRIVGVAVDPSLRRQVAPSIVIEGDMASLAAWEGFPSGDVKLQTGTDAGNKYMRLKDRENGSGARQDVKDRLTTQGTYDVSLKARGKSNNSDTLRVTLRVTSTTGSQHSASLSTVIGKGSWTNIAGTFSVTWPGGVSAAWLEITLDDDQEFYVDDVIVRPRVQPPAPVVPGSWRRIVRDN